MQKFLTVFQIAVSVLLIAAVLLQQRGGGLSPVFGGEEGAYHTRRGLEKTLFAATIVLAFLFIASAFLNLILR